MIHCQVRLPSCYRTLPLLFWNSCGVWLPATKKCDSQCKSLVKKERGCLSKGYTEFEWWQISAIKSCSLSKPPPKHTVLPPCGKPHQFQNTPVRGVFFQKSRSPQLSISHHGSAPRISHKSKWLSGCHAAPPALPLSSLSRLESRWLDRPPPHCQPHRLTGLLTFRPPLSYSRL